MKNIFIILSFSVMYACSTHPVANNTITDSTTNQNTISMQNEQFEINKPEEFWKEKLSPEQYAIIRMKGTERPFTGKFENHWEPGVYLCAACGNELFKSDTKFDAGCGWPSFYEALDKTKITEKIDKTFGMTRIEIMCAKCGGHLGHVFNDGPQDKTGLRYCVNSVSLDFRKKDTIATK
jgi:peptide-methionine (R)-S-oxide reductase